MEMFVDSKSIKPQQHGKADFYSWQLYCWVLKNPQRCQIWKDTSNENDEPVLYIGEMEILQNEERWFHGLMLRQLCNTGFKLRSGITGFAFGPIHNTAHWINVTYEWWVEYMHKGVCAIHGDDAHKWQEFDGIRICQYCKKVERVRIVFQPTVVWEKVA